MKQTTLILISILFSANILSLGLGSMKISSIAGEKFEAEISLSDIQTSEIASTELIKTTKSFSKSEDSIQIENLNIDIFSNDQKTAFKISSDKELDTKYFDFYFVLKLKNGNELKRRYFGILPNQRKTKAVYNERAPKKESFAVMDLGSCSELSDPGERLKCFDKTMGKKIDDQEITEVLTVNGVRFSFDDGSWGLIRASSNKPSLVIVTESPTSNKRKKKIFEFIDKLLQKTGKIGEYDQKI